MVAFTKDPNETGDPNYLGSSRGYSRSDVQADTSLGKLFAGIGEVGDAAAKGFYTAYNQDVINPAVRDMVNPIREAHGGEIAPDQIPAIAGTGARGSKYQAAVDAGQPVGDLAMDPARPLPAGAQDDINSLKRFGAAYQAGEMSNSHYFAALEAGASKLRARYPGWEDEIDAHVSKLTGINPANSLRASVLSDLNSMSAAATAGVNKLQATYQSNQKYMPAGLDFPSYAKNPIYWDTEAGKVKVQEMQVGIQEKQLTLAAAQNKVNAENFSKSYKARADFYVGKVIGDTMHGVFQQGNALIAQGTDANQKEVQATAAKLTALRNVLSNNLDSMASEVLNPDYNEYGLPGVTPNKAISYQKYVPAEELEKQKNLSLAKVDSIITALVGKSWNVAQSYGNLAKSQQDADYNRYMETHPDDRVWPLAKRIYGDTAFAQMLQATNFKTSINDLAKAWSTHTVLDLFDKDNPKPPIPGSDAAATAAKLNGTNPGAAVKHYVAQVQFLAGNDDPEVAFRAVTALADKKLFAQIDPKQKQAAFELLANPEYTKKVIALEGKKPGVLQQYADTMQDAFGVVSTKAISDLQTATTYNKFDTRFDPKTWHFNAITKDGSPVSALLGRDPAMQHVDAINKQIDLMRPILEARYGDQAMPQMLSLLQSNNYNPSAPKHGSFMEELDRGMKSWVNDNIKGPLGLAPKDVPSVAGVTELKAPVDMKEEAPASGVERQRYAFDYFQKAGFTPVQAAGIVGALRGETEGLNTRQIHDGGIGLGISGWNGPRLVALHQYADETGGDFKSLNTQLGFVIHELTGSESKAGDMLRSATTVKQATDAMLLYLRPKDYDKPGAHPERQRYGKQFYSQFAGLEQTENPQ